jgi:hypothetical protein
LLKTLSSAFEITDSHSNRSLLRRRSDAPVARQLGYIARRLQERAER